MVLSSLSNLLGLSMLLCSSIVVYGARHPLAEAPHPPPPPPLIRHPPPPPPRKNVVVEGIVQCVYCVAMMSPDFPLTGDPLPGAVVKLQCNNKKKGPWEEETTTDNNGSFTFRPTKVTTWGAHKCKVSLVYSPRSDCSYIDNNYFEVIRRAFLTPNPTNTTSPFQLFTVGPLWFQFPRYANEEEIQIQ